jgi:hypothetical protein
MGCIAVLIALIQSSITRAEQPDDSLTKTQALLKNRQAREAVIHGDPKAEQADAYTKSIGLSADELENVYGLSGDILKTLVEQTGGDSAQLANKMGEYLRDPASLEKDLTADQKKRIHDVSLRAPASVPTQLDSGVKP